MSLLLLLPEVSSLSFELVIWAKVQVKLGDNDVYVQPPLCSIKEGYEGVQELWNSFAFDDLIQLEWGEVDLVFSLGGW